MDAFMLGSFAGQLRVPDEAVCPSQDCSANNTDTYDFRTLINH
jgi:hypothetical protein